MKTDIDHIDPSWAEGRDYMTICGLEVVFNMAERERRLNSQKSNRFLPWRNTRDELGTNPVEQGDLCLFLDPDTNEWVLEEFLGTWWFEKSKNSDCRANVVVDSLKLSQRMIGNTNSHSQKSPEARARHSQIMKEAWKRRKNKLDH